MLCSESLSRDPKEPSLPARFSSATPKQNPPGLSNLSHWVLHLTQKRPGEEVHLRPHSLSVLLFGRALEMGPSAYSGL